MCLYWRQLSCLAVSRGFSVSLHFLGFGSSKPEILNPILLDPQIPSPSFDRAENAPAFQRVSIVFLEVFVEAEEMSPSESSRTEREGERTESFLRPLTQDRAPKSQLNPW